MEEPQSSITELDTRSSEAPGALADAQASVEATIESCALGGTESTCNNDKNDDKPAVVSENSAATSEAEGEKSLELAEELRAKGSVALKESDYPEAAECFSRALEIKVAHYGELSPECLNAYYKYGCALLYKAQEESDPLGAVPKKEAESKQEPVNGESSSKKGGDGCEGSSSGAANDEGEGSDAEAEDDAEEDESDLDLAWNMLDVARAIAEKQEIDTLEKVDILSALAEVAMEREDLETSLSDYQKSLSILERLVEPDSRRIAELNFRICLCLEIGSKPKEAIPYCEKAISVCQARVQRFKNESKNVSDSTSSSSSVSGLDVQAEIETMISLASELEKKLEDLQQLASSAHSTLYELLGVSASKPKGNESGSSSSVPPPQNASGNGCFDAPRISTASQSGGSSEVTHLGVVGRGVKRVVMSSTTGEQSPVKKPSLESTEDKN